jgi:hypothetical protein
MKSFEITRDRYEEVCNLGRTARPTKNIDKVEVTNLGDLLLAHAESIRLNDQVFFVYDKEDLSFLALGFSVEEAISDGVPIWDVDLVRPLLVLPVRTTDEPLGSILHRVNSVIQWNGKYFMNID